MSVRGKKVKINLANYENQFEALKAWRIAAKEQGWKDDDILEILWKCSENKYIATMTILELYSC